MKKTLLATALAVGFAGAASAQTSVTLYGVVDGGFGYTQYKAKNAPAGFPDKATRTGGYGGNQQGPRWGLRGSEDLGGGLRAAFQLENGFDLFTGQHGQGGRMFGRQAWLGLQSDSWGSLAYGRQLNFASRYVAGVVGVYDDAFGHGAIGETFSSTHTVRYDNMIAYETPSFAGFQLGVGYTFQTNRDQPWDINGGVLDRDQTAFTTALRYSNGPLAVAASYDVLNAADSDDGINPLGEKDVKSWALGASYDFEVVKLHLGFGQDRKGAISGATTTITDLFGGVVVGRQGGYIADDYKTNNYAVGLSVPLGSGQSVAVNWQSARLGSSALKDGVRATGGKTSQNLYSLVYTYDLSRRTNLYAFGTYGTGYGFISPLGTGHVTVTQAIVGLRHRF